MANFLYTKGIQALGTGNIVLDSDTIAAQCVSVGSGAYVASQASDQSLADIPLEARIGDAGVLTDTTFANGVFDANDVTCPNTASATVQAIVLFKLAAGSPTNESECLLLAYIDTASNMPYDAAGADIPIYWNNGANRIFKIGT